jgi:hypothetical protein
MGDLAEPLAGEEDYLECAAGGGAVERGPKLRNLTISQDALAALGGVAVNELAGIAGDKLLLHGPGEDRRDGGERLVGDDRGLDGGHHRLDVGAGDRGRL